MNDLLVTIHNLCFLVFPFSHPNSLIFNHVDNRYVLQNNGSFLSVFLIFQKRKLLDYFFPLVAY